MKLSELLCYFVKNQLDKKKKKKKNHLTTYVSIYLFLKYLFCFISIYAYYFSNTTLFWSLYLYCIDLEIR